MKGVLDSMMNPESCRPVIDPFCKAIQVTHKHTQTRTNTHTHSLSIPLSPSLSLFLSLSTLSSSLPSRHPPLNALRTLACLSFQLDYTSIPNLTPQSESPTPYTLHPEPETLYCSPRHPSSPMPIATSCATCSPLGPSSCARETRVSRPPAGYTTLPANHQFGRGTPLDYRLLPPPPL
jgi:hypothetical protein